MQPMPIVAVGPETHVQTYCMAVLVWNERGRIAYELWLKR